MIEVVIMRLMKCLLFPFHDYSCTTPEELMPPISVSKPATGFTSQFLFMKLADTRKEIKSGSNHSNNSDLSDQESSSNGVIRLNSPPSPPCNGIKANASVVVVKTEPSEIPNGSIQVHTNDSLEKSERSTPSPAGKGRKSPMNGDERNGNSSSDNESTASGSIRIKSESHLMEVDKPDDDEKDDMDTNKMDEDTGTLSSSPRSILSSASSSACRRSPPGMSGSICGSPSPPRSRMGGNSPPQQNGSSSTLIITKQNMLGKDGSGSQRASPLNMPNGGYVSTGGSRGSSPQQSYSNQSSPASMLSHMSHIPPHSVSHHQQQPPMFHSNQLHARLTEGRRDREQREQREREAAHMAKENSDHGSPPLSVVTSTSLSFQQGSLYRIHGVRPEVISGGAVTPNGSSVGTPPIPAITLSQHHPNHQSQQQQQHFQSHHPFTNGIGSNSPPGSFSSNSSNASAASRSSFNNGISKNPHYSYHPSNQHQSHHPDLITGVSRKSPTQLSSLSSSRSPNSSPSNSSTTGSVSSGSSQHSPGSVTISSNGTIVAGGSLGIVNPATGPTSHHHVNLNRTPTVIMGEAGGVRTMLWSTPGQPLSNSSSIDGLSGGSCTPGGGSSPGGSSTTGSTSGSIPPVTNGHTNGATPGYLNQNSPPNPIMQKGALSMELLWASEALNLSTGSGSSNTTNGAIANIMGTNGATNGHGGDDDDYEQPMICMICEDRATGLHYGIITCEG